MQSLIGASFVGIAAHWIFISTLVNSASDSTSNAALGGSLVATVNLALLIGGLTFIFTASRRSYVSVLVRRSMMCALCLVAVGLVSIAIDRYMGKAIAMTAICVAYGLTASALYPSRLMMAACLRSQDQGSAVFSWLSIAAIGGLLSAYLISGSLHDAPVVARFAIAAALLFVSGLWFAADSRGKFNAAQCVPVNFVRAREILGEWRRRERAAFIIMVQGILASGFAFGTLQVVGSQLLASHGDGASYGWVRLVAHSGLFLFALGLLVGSGLGRGRSWSTQHGWIVYGGLWGGLVAIGLAGSLAGVAAALFALGAMLGLMAALIPARLADSLEASERHTILTLNSIALTGAPFVGALASGLISRYVGIAHTPLLVAVLGGVAILAVKVAIRTDVRVKREAP